MARLNKQNLNHKGGLNTEISKVTGNETTYKKGENVFINNKGEISRRSNLEQETNGTLSTYDLNIVDLSTCSLQTFLWSNTNGNPDLELLIVRVGVLIKVYNNSAIPLSSGLLQEIDLTTYAVDLEKAKSAKFNTTFGNELFFLSNKYMETVYFKFNEETNSIYFKDIKIEIRDFESLDDGTDLTENKPVVIYTGEVSDEEAFNNMRLQYNLLNQGWGNDTYLPKERKELLVKNTTADFNTIAAKVDIRYTYKILDYIKASNEALFGIKYPSNVEMSQGFTKKDEFDESFFDAKSVINTEFGSSRAPNGHIILNAFKKQRVYTSLLEKFWRGQGTGSDTEDVIEERLIPVHKVLYYYFEQAHYDQHLQNIADGYVMINPSQQYLDMIETYATTGSPGLPILKQMGGFDQQIYRRETTKTIPTTVDQYILENINVDRLDIADGTNEGIMLKIIPDEISDVRSTAVAFFAGRPFFGSNGVVYFSQLSNDEEKLGYCYQKQDPTSEIFNQLLATDGGVIPIKGCSEILDLVEMGKYLLVIATNGIWAISGGQFGFTASSFSVEKISDIKIDSKESIVRIESGILFWGREGIMSLRITSEGVNLENISESKIKTIFDELTVNAKTNVKAIYNDTKKLVSWYYRNEDGLSIFESNLIDEILTLNLTTEAFTLDKLNLSETSNKVFSLNKRKNSNVNFETNYITMFESETPDIKNVGFSVMNGRTFLDFGVDDYSSFIETEYEGLGDYIRNKSATYIHTWFDITETGYKDNGQGGLIFDYPSSCLLTGTWDWKFNPNAIPQQTYRLQSYSVPEDVNSPFEYDRTVLESKTKLRGKGKVLTNRFESETGKDFKLLGYAVEYNTRT